LTITPASVSNAVSSSANPALTGSNVTFTATLTAVSPGSGTPTGTVQFYADSSPLGSAVALVGGVAGISTSSLLPGAHVISAQYPGDGNFFGRTASLSPGETINSLPVATNIVLQRYQDSGAKISVAALLADNTGPNSGVLTLISADPTSTNGGTVAISSNWIFYTPLPGFTNSDAFSYVIADSEGVQAAGTVSITVPVDLGQSQNIVAVADLGNGAALIQFQAIPGRTYTVQYTESLQTPVWQTLGTSTADATGAFGFTNTPPNGSPAGFYRSTYP
ncbi:MAG TPA: Ig-like domain repeat protein, partial [Candidatus Acidoferrum sp.]|nr:Ig-like domain repeat protein [Candidatus Acidoferrum sp.]